MPCCPILGGFSLYTLLDEIAKGFGAMLFKVCCYSPVILFRVLDFGDWLVCFFPALSMGGGGVALVLLSFLPSGFGRFFVMKFIIEMLARAFGVGVATVGAMGSAAAVLSAMLVNVRFAVFGREVVWSYFCVSLCEFFTVTRNFRPDLLP